MATTTDRVSVRGFSWPRWTVEPPPSVLPGPARRRVASRSSLSVDDVGQPPFQASHRLFAALAFGSFPQVVGPARGVLPDLGKGHAMQA